MRQCEGFNGYLNQYVNKKQHLTNFVDQMARLMRRQQEIEWYDWLPELKWKPGLTTHLREYEQQAGNMYTKNLFEEVRKEIEKEGLLIVNGVISWTNSKTYNFTEFGKVNKEWNVEFDMVSKLACYGCQLFKSKGIPCSHTFVAFKAEDIQFIPKSTQLSWWIKTAELNIRPQVTEPTVTHCISEHARIGLCMLPAGTYRHLHLTV